MYGESVLTGRKTFFRYSILIFVLAAIIACGGPSGYGPPPDTTAPTASSTSPSNNATGISLNAAVSVTFSEAMTNATLTDATFTSVTDAAGNALATNYNLLFTTGAAPDTTPPTVSSTVPANGATSAAGVPLYGIFETQVSNATSYNNPFDFHEIELAATFMSPSGRVVSFFGYYDGDGNGNQTGNVWKLRFSPDELGSWTYVASFSDGQPGLSGSFDAVAQGAKPGPVRVDPTNPRWLLFANGERYYPRGYYHSESFSATDPFWENDLDNFFGPTWGFNFNSTIFWQNKLITQLGWNARPFNGFYPVIPGDVTRFDVSAWRHVDAVLEKMSDLKTVWFNFDGFIANVGGDRPANVYDEEILLRNWIARLAPYWNVTWNVAFEWQEFMLDSDVNRVANYVNGIDPWDHLITVHNHGLGTEPSGSLSWLDFFSIQNDAGVSETAGEANGSVLPAGSRPVYAQEVVWEGDDKLTADEVRRGGWGVIVGAGILNYAEQFFINGVSEYGSGGGFPYVKIMFDTIEQMQYWTMSPHNELVSGGAEAYCLAEPGQQYLIYAASGGTIQLKLNNETGTFATTWINPRTGATNSGANVNGGGTRSITAPDSSNDWALIVTR